jgi:hypothetical protein
MNVIITLTTIPTRLVSMYEFDIKYNIESLLNQNYEDYEVHMNIPHLHNSTNTEYVLPEWLVELEKNNHKLKIFRTEDYGPITKLLPTLERVKDPSMVIIVVDDDMVYHPELINEHLKNREKWPEYPVGYDGLTSVNEDGSHKHVFQNSRDYFYSANGIDSYVEIIQHYKTVSYFRRMFDGDFFKFIKENGCWCDDTTISAYFAMKKTPRVVTFYEKDQVANTLEEWLSVVGNSFPLVKGTQHDSAEGCQIYRQEGRDNEKMNNLNKFLSKGYQI